MEKFILICGLPRSGTTLMETVLGSHSQISLPPGDYPFAEQYIKGFSVEKIFSTLSTKGPWGKWCVKDFSDLFDKSHAEAFRDSMIRYAAGIGKKIPAAKAPCSEFFYEIYQEWLQDFDLRFVHVVRNPFDVMASLKKSSYHKDMFAFENTIDLQSKNWRRSTSIGLALGLIKPENYRMIQYEKFVEDPTSYTKAICSFLQVEFEAERMLNRVDYSYHDTNTSFPTDKKENTQGRYIYRAESRKSFLNKSEIEVVCRNCGETAKTLGYEDKEFRISPPLYPQKMKTTARIKRKIMRAYRKIF
jgi:hypothetical protein